MTPRERAERLIFLCHSQNTREIAMQRIEDEFIADRAEIAAIPIEASDAKKNLLGVLPYIRYAVAEAAKKGAAKLGILCEFADGGGKIEARFEMGFLDDLAVVIEAPPQTPEDDMKAKAREFSDTLLTR